MSESTSETSSRRQRKTRIGRVTSDKMEKTIVVEVPRRIRHPRYHKFVTRRAKYKAHDERGLAKVGDWVLIEESRPLSRDKRWTLKALVDRGGSAAATEPKAER